MDEIAPPPQTCDEPSGSERELFDRRARQVEESLRRVAASLASQPDQADELVQETLIRMWERRDRYSGRGSYRAWAVAIMRNIWKDQQRRLGRQAHVVLWSELPEALEIADPRADLEAVHWDRHRAQVVRRALRRLSPDEREALTARHCEELSLREVAERMGLTRGQAERLLRRACDKFRGMDDVLKLVMDG